MQGEADDQQHRQADGAGGGAAADRESLAEVVQADAHGDQQGQAAGRRPGADAQAAGGQLAGGHRARTVPGRPAAPGQPALVPDQAEQADAEPGQEQRAVARHRADAARVVVERAERRVHRLPGVGEHVPDEEQEDADGERVQELPEALARGLQPADRQAEQDRHPGDEAEDEGLRLTHRR